ncbi:hypothetical protein, partial [Aminipila sp.]|uniref:hypothetical protein n=1 Tax=Aminipila sp. TaxID=2060095 RepID=UPI002F3F7052
MIKNRKLWIVVLSFIMVFSTSFVSAFALEKKESGLSTIYLEKQQVVMDADIQLPSNVDFEGANGIDVEFNLNSSMNTKSLETNIQAESLEENRAPIADLRYVIMNPETLINGNITTNTQIAWLWSYNGEDYTYDPDGDAIISKNLGGISQSDIVGMLTGDIGFVTQFSVPAEYIMTYQVTDEKGAKSNVYSIRIAVEPADGNTRPVCSLEYTSPVQALSPVTINWQNSSDPDEGDAITDFRGIVYKNGAQRNITDYIVPGTLTSNSVKLLLPEVGIYEIWASVKDSHGAWSNWAIFTVQVQQAAHNNDSCFVYVSTEYRANGLFQPSIGYLGKTTYNGEDAYYISSNATIYGSIARNLDNGGVDRTVAN